MCSVIHQAQLCVWHVMHSIHILFNKHQNGMSTISRVCLRTLKLCCLESEFCHTEFSMSFNDTWSQEEYFVFCVCMAILYSMLASFLQWYVQSGWWLRMATLIYRRGLHGYIWANMLTVSSTIISKISHYLKCHGNQSAPAVILNPD